MRKGIWIILLLIACGKKSAVKSDYGTFAYNATHYSPTGTSSNFSFLDTMYSYGGSPIQTSPGLDECVLTISPIPSADQPAYSYYIGSYYTFYLGSNATYGAGTLPANYKWGYLSFSIPANSFASLDSLPVGQTLTFSGGTRSLYVVASAVTAYLSSSLYLAPLGDSSYGISGPDIYGNIDSATVQIQFTRNSNNQIAFTDETITNTVDGIFSLTALGSDGSQLTVTNGTFKNLPLKQ
jgi:hypothetical protein